MSKKHQKFMIVTLNTYFPAMGLAVLPVGIVIQELDMEDGHGIGPVVADFVHAEEAGRWQTQVEAALAAAEVSLPDLVGMWQQSTDGVSSDLDVGTMDLPAPVRDETALTAEQMVSVLNWLVIDQFSVLSAEAEGLGLD